MSLDQLIQWYFDFPPVQAGERIFWILIRRDYFPPSYVIWGLLLVIVMTCWLSLRSQTGLKSWIQLGLRLLTISLFAVMFLQVNLRGTHRGRPFVNVLVDNSLSMQSGDTYSKSELSQLRQLLKSQTTLPRHQLVKAVFETKNDNWLTELLTSHRVKFYEFGANAQPLELSSHAEGSEIRKSIQNLTFSRPKTNFSESVAGLFDEHRGSLPDAIVLFTDGNSTEKAPGELSAIAARCRAANVPVYVVGVGSQQSPLDLKIEAVTHEPVGFAGSAMPIEVSLSSNSTTSQSVQVTLRDQLNNVIDTTQIELKGTQQVSLNVPDLQPGRNDFRISLNELPGETDLSNNLSNIRIWARESRLKVLMIERLPRWEFHHLKKTWERDPHVQLHVFLMDSDVQFTQEDQSAISQLPSTTEELISYDVIVLGDVDLTQLDQRFINNLPNHVSEEGAGLLMIAGRKFNPVSYLNSPLASLLPVRRVRNSTTAPSKEKMEPQITLEGRKHSLLNQDELESRWAQLRLSQSYFSDIDLRPGSLTLLEGRRNDQLRVPLILSMRYGTGQILQHLFDQSWQWRVDVAAYQVYWSQALRFLAKQRMNLERTPYELSVPREEFLTGESVTITLENRRRTASKNPIEFALQKDGQPLPPGALSKRDNHQQDTDVDSVFYQAELDNLSIGTYIASINFPNESPITTTWRVIESDLERRYAPMNRRDLSEASKLSQGGLYEIWELDQLVKNLPSTSRGQQLHSQEVPIWNRWEIIALLVLCLSTDWLLRRRRE